MTRSVDTIRKLSAQIGCFADECRSDGSCLWLLASTTCCWQVAAFCVVWLPGNSHCRGLRHRQQLPTINNSTRRLVGGGNSCTHPAAGRCDAVILLSVLGKTHPVRGVVAACRHVPLLPRRYAVIDALVDVFPSSFVAEIMLCR